jgi:hypothetical protein
MANFWMAKALRPTVAALTTSVLTLLPAAAPATADRGTPEPQQATARAELATYSYRLEAWNSGNLVATEPFTTVAQNDQQAAQFVQNKLAVWGQQLNARGIRWNRLSAVFVSKS